MFHSILTEARNHNHDLFHIKRLPFETIKSIDYSTFVVTVAVVEEDLEDLQEDLQEEEVPFGLDNFHKGYQKR